MASRRSLSDSDCDSDFCENAEDLSHSSLDLFPFFDAKRILEIQHLRLNNNIISELPKDVYSYRNLLSLDLSNNSLTVISDGITKLTQLKTLLLQNNLLRNESLPKDLSQMHSLNKLNMGGNQLSEFPPQLFDMKALKNLYLGGNEISFISCEIHKMRCLEVLYLGGNRLTEIPESMGALLRLHFLNLCDNQLHTIPSSLSRLRNLVSLSLHNNQLSTLPPAIVTLNLEELSLRNNPLIVRFVDDMVFEPTSLIELSARVIKNKNITYSKKDLPLSLVNFLDSASHCVNPKCQGVYFKSHVENIKFVDFCGKYRLPLLQYLCSPYCATKPLHKTSESESDEDGSVYVRKMRKVLLDTVDNVS